MIENNNPKNLILSKVIQYNLAELLDGIRQAEHLLHDFKEIIWTIEEKLREEGMNVPERKI